MTELSRAKEDAVTADYVRSVLDYDPNTGIFTWEKSGCGRSGMRAGSMNANGYWQIGIGGAVYTAHRLAWLHTHGAWPLRLIDHVDGNKANNALANLREASRVQNAFNQKANKRRSGILTPKGAYFSEKGQNWKAVITTNGRRRHLGYYPTPEAAHAAYVKAAITEHQQFARTQ